EDEDDEYEDEDYEDEDDEYEDEDYEDEDDEYEDEDYEDEDDEYDDDDGVIVRFKRFLTEMSSLDMVVAMLGIVVLAGVIITGGLYVNAKSVEKQVETFANVGGEMEGISVIGESGLLAVAESAKLSGMIDIDETIEGEQQTGTDEMQSKTIEVALNITSIQSDIKIKFVNKATGKLIGGVPFEVEVTGGKTTLNYQDDDKDGIIYKTEIPAGTYNVTVKPLTGDAYQDYRLPASSSSVTVTDTIAYKKVDVADEVKTEAEVNVAAEDTAVQDTVVESTLKDTVEWVESTKTPVGDAKDGYEEVPKANIPDPWTVSSAYRKMVVMPLSTDTPTEPGDTTNPGGDVTSSSDSSTQTPSDGSTTTPSDGSTTTPSDGSTTTPSDGSTTTPSDGSTTTSSSTSTTTPSTPSTTTSSGTTGTPSQPQQPTNVILSLNSTSQNLKKGASVTLSVAANPNNVVLSVEWLSGNNAVATVSSAGVVNAVGTGTTSISAKVAVNGIYKETLTCNVTVTAADRKVTISGPTEVAIGKTITLTAQTEPKDTKVRWGSGNEKIAKIDANGVLTGIAEGKVEIVAHLEGDMSTYTIYVVTVKKDLDGTAKLKDKDGNQMYYKDATGAFKEATYNDYKTQSIFYKKTAVFSQYKYTGWQTIDGHVYFFDKSNNYVTGEQVIQGAKYNFGSDGKLAAGSGTMGIDVSKWNGSIDWNAVKNSGVSYVIIRCGYRGSSTGALIEDPLFRSNIKGAKAAGLKVGVYFFSQAVNEVEAVEEASMAVNLCSGYGLNYPIFLDVESSGGRGDSISKDMRTAVCKAFCATVQNSGYSAGVYANKNWFTEKINTASLTGYKIWLAQYASAPTYSATRYDMWQYSSKGKVSGISGNVDMNVSYMNY
ncbi:MAG: Ig-like domain-containing protein, partial [Lachnospiraceae bacterium]|nr:Ig-like domain-containing protein [Lachnospiraceae bacterium]